MRCAAASTAAQGLSVPELSVLLAWTKIVLADELLASDLPDDPYLHLDLMAYFPRPVREGFETQIRDHPLRREIIVTQVVNDLVNGAGMTFWPRLAGETGASAAELTNANFVSREIFGSLGLREELDDLRQRARRVRADPDADRDAHPGRALLPVAGHQPATAPGLGRDGRVLHRPRAGRDGTSCRT